MDPIRTPKIRLQCSYQYEHHPYCGFYWSYFFFQAAQEIQISSRNLDEIPIKLETNYNIDGSKVGIDEKLLCKENQPVSASNSATEHKDSHYIIVERLTALVNKNGVSTDCINNGHAPVKTQNSYNIHDMKIEIDDNVNCNENIRKLFAQSASPHNEAHKIRVVTLYNNVSS